MTNADLPRPPFDNQLEAALDDITTTSAVTIDSLLKDARVTRRDVTIPGRDGATIVVTVLQRRDRTGSGPGIFFIHGGGMISGDRFVGNEQFLPWIVDLDAVVVTVEYRLAPEFPDPYPVEDCYAGLRWTADHATALGIDPHRLLIAGASAGGGLAAGSALLARDRGEPPLVGQLLIYPMVDDRDLTVSSAQFNDVGTWKRRHNVAAWTALLGARRATDDVSIYAAPARAEDLSGLPTSFVECGSAEIFRDEDVAYATALWHAGVQVELHVWPGGFHGFDVLTPQTELARTACTTRNAWVRRVLTSL